MGSVKKSIKKSRKKYLKRNKTKGKTREYRRTKNKRQRNKKSKNKRLTKKNKRYSNKSREKFIRKKKVYQGGGVVIDFRTLTPEQVDILTYSDIIRKDIEWKANKDKICRITGCMGSQVLPKMLMMDREAKAIGPVRFASFADHITYSVMGTGERVSKRAEYKPVSELCYWMIKVAEKGATSVNFSTPFDPSRVEGRSICKVENYGSFNINSAYTLVIIFHGLLDLILGCLTWYKNDYEPLLESDKFIHNRAKTSNSFEDQLEILTRSLKCLYNYLIDEQAASAEVVAAPEAPAEPEAPAAPAPAAAAPAQAAPAPAAAAASASASAVAGLSVTPGRKREQLVELTKNLSSLFAENNIPYSEIDAYLELCARLRFFDVTESDDSPMLDFMIDRIPTLKGILNATFFEDLVEEVRVKRNMAGAELTKATEAAREGWLSALPLPRWGKKAAPAAGPGEIEIEMDAIGSTGMG